MKLKDVPVWTKFVFDFDKNLFRYQYIRIAEDRIVDVATDISYSIDELADEEIALL